MQVSVEATNGLERRMKVQIPADQIESEVDQRLRRVGKTAKLKGFRPGKVPFKVIRKEYGGQVRREVLSEVMQSSFTEAITREKLRPAGGPRIEADEVEQGQDLQYTAVFEIYPEIEISDVSSIAVEKPVAEILKEDIDAMVENLRQQRADWETVDRAASDGDQVTVDYSGTLDGEAFDGGKGEAVPIVLGAGRMLPDFERGLEGIAAGESRSFDVAFPEDYPAENLASKTANFAAAAKSVEQQVLPELDEEFCKAFGVDDGDVEKLGEEVASHMRKEMEQKVKQILKAAVLDKLLEANPIELPQALVDDEVTQLQHDTARRLGQADGAQLPPREPFEEQARRRVSLGLLINEVIKTQNIEIDKTKVSAHITDLADGYPEPEAVIKAYNSQATLMAQAEVTVLEQQVVDWLLEQAKITETQIAFKELMNFGK